jgi:glycine dehydrogenase subunit 1
LSRYTSITDDDLAEMLAEIGIDSIDELFADVPDELRLSGPLDTDDGLSEQEVYGQLRSLAQRNISARARSS